MNTEKLTKTSNAAGKKNFDPIFLSRQRERLLAEKGRLEKELARHGHRGSGKEQDYRANFENLGDDEESNAAEYALAEVNIGLVENLEAELRRVASALGRIKKGTYGFDIKTGQPINSRRLETNPAAESDV